MEVNFEGTEATTKTKSGKDLKESDCKYRISPFNLRINDMVLNTKFDEFKCENTQKHSLIVLLAFVAILVALMVLLSFEGKDAKRTEYLYHLFYFGLLSISLSFSLFFSAISHRVAMLISPVIALTLTICIFLVNLKAEPEKLSTQVLVSQMPIVLLIYLLQLGLFNIRFLENMVSRVIPFWAAMILLIVKSAEVGDINVVTSFSFVFLFTLLMEILFYLESKTKVELFLIAQVNNIKQEQLLNMFDAVPDKLLICKPGDEHRSSTGIFCNFSMKKFLGIDTHSESDNSTEQGDTLIKSHKLMNRRIFTSQSSSNSPLFTAQPASCMSLNEIVVQHQLAANNKDSDEPAGSKMQEFQVRSKKDKYTPQGERPCIVQLKIFDVIHDQQPCNLIYMRDITRILEKKREEAECKQGCENAVKMLLSDPLKFIQGLASCLQGRISTSTFYKIESKFKDLEEVLMAFTSKINSVEKHSIPVLNPNHVRELIKDAVEESRPLAPEITFKEEINFESPSEQLRSKKKLRDALTSLVKLAAHQSDKQGKIFIKSEIQFVSENRMLVISVTWSPELDRQDSENSLVSLIQIPTAVDFNPNLQVAVRSIASNLDGEMIIAETDPDICQVEIRVQLGFKNQADLPRASFIELD